MEEAKKMKLEKTNFWTICPSLRSWWPQFLSYLPKRFTHLCRALYGDAILVYRFGSPIWPPEINKNIWSSLFLWKLFLSTRKPAYVRINISSNTWNGYTAENQEERLFSTRQHSYFGVTHCENLEVQIAVFSKWNVLREWKLVQGYIRFVYLQPSVNKNS